MAKRQAEKQLTDQNWRDEDNDQTASSGPMKLATPQIIQTRQIRGLPKKSAPPTSSAPSSALNPTPSIGSTVQNPFAAFGQASNKPAGSNPLAPSTGSSPGSIFGSTTATATGPFASQTQSLFGTTPSSQPSLFGASASPKPSLFSAPISKTPDFNSPWIMPTPQPPSAEAITMYYASLRGLNLSVVYALEELTKKDAFINLTNTFDQLKSSYIKHRALIEQDLRSARSGRGKDPSNNPSIQSTAPPSFSPTSFRNTNPSSAEQSQSDTSPPDDANGGLANGPTAQMSKTSFRPGAISTAAPTRPSPLRFETGEGSSSEVSTSKPAESHPPTSSLFAPSAASSTPGASWAFGSSSGTPDKPDESGGPSLSNPLGPPKSSIGTAGGQKSLFGSSTPGSSAAAPGSAPFSFATANAGNTTGSAPSFKFGMAGTPTSMAPSFFGGFGSPKSVIEASPPKNGFNPVGFSFGNSPPTSASGGPGSQQAKPAGFSFGSSPSTSGLAVAGSQTANAEKGPETCSGAGSGMSVGSTTGLPAPVSLTTSAPSNPTDLSGPEKTDQSPIADTKKGEEDEDTVFETTGRIYALLDKLQDDGTKKKQWVGWAVCCVKLNRNKLDSKKARILARNVTNKNILVNFNVRSDLKPEIRGSALEFLGFDGNLPQAYRVRPGSIEIVEEFCKAIKGVVEGLSG